MWKLYKSRALTEIRPYEVGEDLDGITIPPRHEPEMGDMICRRHDKPEDQWLIAKEYFMKNYELVSQ